MRLKNWDKGEAYRAFPQFYSKSTILGKMHILFYCDNGVTIVY
jgi:hypothetical protein